MNNYLYLKISGININRFLLRCNKNNINLLKIKNKSYKSVIILIKSNDYDKLLKYKGIYKISVINKIGLNKVNDLMIKYKYLIISSIFSFIVLIVLSNIIFKVSIITDNPWSGLCDVLVNAGLNHTQTHAHATLFPN